MSDVWTILEALNFCVEYLQHHNDNRPRLSAELLIAHATNYSRLEIYAHFDQPLTMEERALLREHLRLRGQGVPIQYILKKAPFYTIELELNQQVLIPRPETEILVEESIKFIQAHAHNKRVEVLDLCTGSGCIALSIAHEYPSTQVVALDISSQAVNCAIHNSKRLKLTNVTCLQSNLYERLGSTYHKSFDLIVSNPPYIPSHLISELPHEVKDYEPHLALDGGTTGLELYTRILKDISCYLKPQGLFICELHETCLDQAKIIAQEIFEDVTILEDLTHRPRFIKAGALRA